MAIQFDDIREHMPEGSAQDDKTFERSLGTLPVRILLLMEVQEMAVYTRRFDARIKEAARPER